MRTEYFQYILEVWKCGSINKAAQNLYLSQPNLSTTIRMIELDLGFDIFKRHSTGVELTQEGAVLVRSAQIILNEMDKIKEIPYLFNNHKNLSIACTNSALFMESFIRFREQFPEDDVYDYFKETGLNQAIQDVIQQHYRLCIFYCFAERAEHYHKMAAQYNMEMLSLSDNIPLELVVSAKSPILKETSISFKEISKYHFVTYEDFPFEDWLEPLGFKNKQNITYIFDRGGLLDTIRHGNCVTITMKGGIELTKDSGCVALPVSGLKSRLGVYMIKSTPYQLSPREYRFIKYIKERLASIK